MLVRWARVFATAAACAVGLVATLAAPTSRAQAPTPKPLWDAFPLDQRVGGDRQGSQPAMTPTAAAKRHAARRGSSHSATPKTVAVVAAVLIGIVIGLIPALLLGIGLREAPRPRLARLRRRATARAVRPGAERAPPAPTLIVFDPHPAEPAAPERTLAPTQVQASLLAPVGDEAVLARERHRELYDAEYSDQLLRIETLRRTISARLAVSASSLADDVPPTPQSDE
jgi:hypothetical protein